MKRLLVYFFLICCFSFCLTGCNDDETVQPPINENPQAVQLIIGTSVDGNPLAYDVVYNDFAPVAVIFSRVAFYMSEISFQKGDNEPVNADTSLVLLRDDDQSESFVITEVPNEGFNELRFFAGLAADLNHADPLLASAPLDDPSMHWGWNPEAGYVFLKIQGRIDTDGDGAITNSDSEFQYHCATDALLRPISLPIATASETSADGPIFVNLNMRELLDQVTVSAGFFHGATEENVQLMDNFDSALEAAQ